MNKQIIYIYVYVCTYQIIDTDILLMFLGLDVNSKDKYINTGNTTIITQTSEILEIKNERQCSVSTVDLLVSFCVDHSTTIFFFFPTNKVIKYIVYPLFTEGVTH